MSEFLPCVNDGVCAVIVTFNRKLLLIQCLDSLLKQTHKLAALCIIDNCSTDGTSDELTRNGYIAAGHNTGTNLPFENDHVVAMRSSECRGEKVHVHYVRLGVNAGGAGGFHAGVKLAYDKGYGWLWLMDDDAEAAPDCLELLMKSIAAATNKYSGATPLKKDKAGSVQMHHFGRFKEGTLQKEYLRPDEFADQRQLIEVSISSFVGLLVPREQVTKIGLPDEKLFLWQDDLDYSYRLTRGLPLVLVKQSIMFHQEFYAAPKAELHWLSSSDCRFPIAEYWRYYYGMRNSIYLINKHFLGNVIAYAKILKGYFEELRDIIVFDNHKLARMQLITKALCDGFSSCMGRRIDAQAWLKKVRKK